MNLLLIEDERQLSEALAVLLRQQSYLVDAAYDGVTGEEYALSGIYDGIILDIMLPRKNGLEVLRSLRNAKLSTPVLLLTAKAEMEDKILGLDTGADDYITKPFATVELLARVRAMTRRKGEILSDTLVCQDTFLHKAAYELNCRGNTVRLAPKEYLILELFMQNEKQIIPRERFMEKIWGFDSEAEYNAIEVYISFIRRKLEAIHSDMRIRTVRGIGYTLEGGQ
ncbi:MAG: response regulator transcription factor [Peptococcaceae bacterium]|nr:response regulator transcription factor [Peptococcaceae bacterium]